MKHKRNDPMCDPWQLTLHVGELRAFKVGTAVKNRIFIYKGLTVT